MEQRFSEGVYQIVKEIPPGKVATYGQIAARLGNLQAVRAVGNALHNNPDPKTIPCHRVVNREGRLVPGFREQRRKLLSEGVKFRDRNNVDLEKNLWKSKEQCEV